MPAHRTIPQRELRNDVAAILREAEAGTEFTVTVRGRPVAKLGPVDALAAPREDVDRETLRRFFERNPPDEAWAAELAEMRAAQPPIDDPWNDG
jgi:prevent-host-death family protein